MSLLKLKNVTKVYKKDRCLWGPQSITEAVKNVDLTIEEGTCLGLVGESGCGKSTLGKIILGLMKPNEGEVIFQGENFYNSNSKQQHQLRKNLQVVFQDYSTSANPKHNVEKIISEPIRNFLKLSPLEEKKKILELLDIVGLNPRDISKYPHQFSGGQLQRICIAKAIALKPKLIVLDEAISSLDVSVQAQILNLLKNLKEEYGLSYLFISHDIEAVSYIADSVAVMYLGTIVEEIQNITNIIELKHPYSKKLLSSVLSSDPDVEKYLNHSFDDVSINKEISCGCRYLQRCEKAKELCNHQSPSLDFVKGGHKIACHCKMVEL